MRRSDLEWRLQGLWYDGSWSYRLLLPLSWLYCGFSRLRRTAYRLGLLRSTALGCRVVVVGNLVAGGSGKTPLVIALARTLQNQGLRVGVLCRGYRGRSKQWPVAVRADSDPVEVGDEAVLIAQKTGLPVMAGPRRVDAGKALLRDTPCDVLLCDDGLQHYALRRDIEILVIDAERGYGNGACLPAGPLREPRARVGAADAVVALGGPCAGATTVMHYVGGEICKLLDPQHCYRLDAFAGQVVHAVAGIGYPQRFFRQLLDAGLSLEAHAFDDHHLFTPQDLAFSGGGPVLMTEKDAVKCRAFARSDWWVVPVEAQLDGTFEAWLVNALNPREH
jgi:tetraacyldisaccharide 4'-kinase